VDVTDALGTPIRIDTRGPEVLRILPRPDDDLNEEWMADKGRFSFDGLKRRRLDRPWVRRDGKLLAATWSEAFAAIAARLRGLDGARIGAVVGDLCDAESMVALKDLFAALGSRNIDCRQDGARLDASRRDFYLFNAGVAGIDQADALLIVGSNPRHESPVLNARIRKRSLAGKFPIGVVGPAVDLTYGATFLGDTPDLLTALHDGSHPFARALMDAARPMILLGQGALMRPDGAAVLAATWRLAEAVGALKADWHGFNMLHTAAARVGALDLGFVPGTTGLELDQMMGGGVDLLWLLGADEFDTARIGAETFTVYQGHHGDRGAARADVILPGCAYTEKDGTYVNTEGRVQRGWRATFAPGEAREDWRILRAFSDVIGQTLPYDDLAAVRARLEQVNPVFARVGLKRFGAADLHAPHGDPAALSAEKFVAAIGDYYQTNPISRASLTMAECSLIYTAPQQLAAE
jgi:NADH-quinone oxidoreductase subunit G